MGMGVTDVPMPSSASLRMGLGAPWTPERVPVSLRPMRRKAEGQRGQALALCHDHHARTVVILCQSEDTLERCPPHCTLGTGCPRGRGTCWL